MWNSIRYALKQAFVQVFRNRAMSMASIFSITAMLLILGLFFVLIVNITTVAEMAKNEYDTIEVSLLDETSYDQAQVLITQISNMEAVADVTYKTREDAIIEWQNEWGDIGFDIQTVLGSNPLPNSIMVTVLELEASDKVVKSLKQLSGIESIQYYKDTVETLLKVTKFIQIGALCIILFMVIISVVVVSNTIKLTVFAREREIGIMKYVGATNWFIRGPFLIEGMLIGALSAGVSVGLVAFIYKKIFDLTADGMMLILSTPLVPLDFMVSNTVVIFLAVGISIGACGSIISMRRFLDT